MLRPDCGMKQTDPCPHGADMFSRGDKNSVINISKSYERLIKTMKKKKITPIPPELIVNILKIYF